MIAPTGRTLCPETRDDIWPAPNCGQVTKSLQRSVIGGIPMSAYDKMTQADFDRILLNMLTDMTGAQLFMQVPGIQSDVME